MMNEDNSKWTDIAYNITIALFLSFILREAWIQFADDLFPYKSLIILFDGYKLKNVAEIWDILSGRSKYALFQFFVFLTLLIRFYGGAYRFHEEAKQLDKDPSINRRMIGTFLSLSGALFLFGAFFAAAHEVTESETFLFVMFFVHLFDLVWFTIMIFYFFFVLKLEWRSSIITAIKLFWLFSAVTIVGFIWLYTEYENSLYDGNLDLQYLLLYFLMAISVLDGIWLRKFYLAPEAWRAQFRRQPKIYLAGPDVFSADSQSVSRRKKAICEKYGLVGAFPLDNAMPATIAADEVPYQISRQNEQLMRSCDAVIANMTPFRGPSTDVGTAFEMGFMRALEKPVFAYSKATDTYFERVRAYFQGNLRHRPNGKDFEDPNGMYVENFGLVDNPMLDGAVKASNGTIEIALNATNGDLEAFEKCVARLSAKLLCE